MTSGQAKQIVLLSVVLAGALASVKPLREGDTPPLALGVGVVVLAVMLLALADVSPRVATMFGLIVLVSATTQLGPDPFNTISKLLPSGKKK